MKRKRCIGALALLLLMMAIIFQAGQVQKGGCCTGCKEAGCGCRDARPSKNPRLYLRDVDLSASFAGEDRSKATFRVRVKVANRGGAVDEVVVETALTDREGNRVAFLSDVVEGVGKGAEAVSCADVAVKQPHLGSAEAPYLYTVTVELKNRWGKTVDSRSSSFSFRQD